MLEKIINITNVGVLQAALPKVISLEKVALIYADNARGKSTLSALLRACADGDAAAVVGRTTFGATTPQRVNFRFKGATGSFNCEFDGTTWNAERAKLLVFNQEFVERNVFAGEGVRPEQREALLEFALGDAAVAQRAEFDKQADLQRQRAAETSSADRALQGYRGEVPLDAFIALPVLPDVARQIDAVDKALAEAKDVERIRNRPTLRQVPVPTFDLDNLKMLVASELTSLSAAAEATVKAHFAAHNGSTTERWVAEGIHQKTEPTCPFCGQETEGVELIKAYGTYFDMEYRNQLRDVTSMPQRVLEVVNEGKVEDWRRPLEFNSGVFSSWESSLELAADALPILDVDSLSALVRKARERLLVLAAQKAEQPLTAISTAVIEEVGAELQEVLSQAAQFNERVAELNAKLDAYKATLSTVDTVQLQRQRAALVAQAARHQPEVVELVNVLLTARKDYKAAESAKDAAKTQLDALMVETLAKFEVGINYWLTKFGAPFSVEKLAPTYKGGGLRSEYVLKVRGARVKVGPGEAGDLNFHVALSEGDKRTLAFAFFLARLFTDNDRGQAVVVLDDVFTSLDRHRRHQTADAVARIGAECAQVIALGHDAYFLQELKKRVIKKKVGTPQELALHRDANDFSILDDFDLDEYCATEYYKHYVLVERFAGGDHTVPLLEVAKALRPLVEGHLHRCFPKRFKEGHTVGEMLDHVKNATAGNPLARLQPHLPELVNFNEFASGYHHDTSGSEPRTDVNGAEMLPFARGALGFIQSRQFA